MKVGEQTKIISVNTDNKSIPLVHFKLDEKNKNEKNTQ
jgi:hypothetical protein